MKKSILAITLIFALVINITSVFAGWSKRGTFDLKSGWETRTITHKKLSAVKKTDANYFYVYTHAKTMWSSPAFRLVNSDNEKRSKNVRCAQVGNRVVGRGNLGVPGYRYYASVKPAWNQIGADTIKLSFSPK